MNKNNDYVYENPFLKVLVKNGSGRTNSYRFNPPVFILIFCCLLVYGPVFSHQFQFHWDDQWVVLNDYTEGGFNTENIGMILTEFFHGQYSPVNEFFYLALYNLFGYSAFWFHAASLVIHVSNVLLLFFLLKKLLRQSTQFREPSVLRISFIASLLMAIHPFLVEAVSWMSASKCILYAFFYLSALHFYLNYLTSKKVWYYVLTLLLFIISFGAKEQAVTLPVCLLLFDFVLKRDMQSSKVWFEKLPFFCLSVSFAIITFYSQAYNGEGVLSTQPHYPIYQNLVFATYTITEYFIKCICPIRLSYIYPFPNLPGEPMPFYLWLYPVVLLFAATAFWKFWSKSWVLFGTGFFLIQISIVSNIIPTSRFAIVADRYVYLPSVGIFFLISYLLDEALQKKNSFRLLLLSCGLTYFICLGIYARQRCKVWHSSDTLKNEMKQTIKSRTDYNEWKKKNNISE